MNIVHYYISSITEIVSWFIFQTYESYRVFFKTFHLWLFPVNCPPLIYFLMIDRCMMMSSRTSGIHAHCVKRCSMAVQRCWGQIFPKQRKLFSYQLRWHKKVWICRQHPIHCLTHFDVSSNLKNLFKKVFFFVNGLECLLYPHFSLFSLIPILLVY